MVDVQRVIDRCRRLLVQDHLAARLGLAALVQRLLKDEEIRCIVVGGTAVDTYVSGAFGTSETYPAGWAENLVIDTVVMKGLGGVSKDQVVQVLERHGFEATRIRSGGKFPGLDIPVDFVGDGLPDDYSSSHLYDVHMESWEELGVGPVHVASPEDILFDYMESGWDTRHQRDWARALAVAAVMEDHLDLGYLFSKAEWRMDGAFVEPLERLLWGDPLRIPPD